MTLIYSNSGRATGNRTPVPGLKGQCSRPLNYSPINGAHDEDRTRLTLFDRQVDSPESYMCISYKSFYCFSYIMDLRMYRLKNVEPSIIFFINPSMDLDAKISHYIMN